MKIITLSAVLCLAAAAAAKSDVHHPSIIEPGSLDKRTFDAVGRHEDQHKSSKHKEHGVEAHNDGGKKSRDRSHKDDHEEEDDEKEDEKEKKGGKSDEEDDDDKKKKGDDKKKDDDDKKDDSDEKKKSGDDDKKKGGDDKKKEGDDDKKKGGDDKKTGGEGKDASKKGSDGKPAVGKDAKPIVDGKNGVVPNPTTNPNIPRDYANPLWLVQPFGGSVWEQGRAYVISWGPNPDPIYSKNLQAKAPVDIRLMRGPPEKLSEIQLLKTGVDSSVHMFQWTVPATVPLAKDYSIRITHAGDLDTYSHYFEIVKAGDPRSTKSNVGEPLQMPKKGDSPQSLNKGPIKPAAPPNPLPGDKAATPPDAAKPAKPVNAADSMSPNIMAFALTLFGAVYFL
ncbi:hypothetical protein EMPS_06489 [Entomortierella parvispora]|uniref:Yeast cell wall synthesis Kre9/Knh1-like N-terminal domain-containing protein n=1 Tax=Entomortierella parvispora TaxID=205924 RepID=A0A9P3HCN7_9FUNG|nr:hypothetical protein EMPS_06489 [Entomortierella parvispora]